MAELKPKTSSDKTLNLKIFPKPADQTLREVICLLRLRRQHLGLSQEAVTQRLGVTPYLVSKWENGFRNPRGLELQAWAATLGCKLVLEPEDKE